MLKSLFKKLRRKYRPMRKYYRKRFNMTLKEWTLYHQKNIVFDKVSSMGAKALKNPFDMWIYQEIIYEVKPDIIIEIGSYEGGSTLYFAHLLDILKKGNVISVEINRSRYKAKHERIIEVTGDSSSPEVLKKVAELCKDKTVLVIHDGDHRKKQVLKDLNNYSEFVSVGSYLIVEDGNVDLFKPGDGLGWMEPGPLAATDQFLRENLNFKPDRERERYILTYNPKGFLKRIK